MDGPIALYCCDDLSYALITFTNNDALVVFEGLLLVENDFGMKAQSGFRVRFYKHCLDVKRDDF